MNLWPFHSFHRIILITICLCLFVLMHLLRKHGIGIAVTWQRWLWAELNVLEMRCLWASANTTEWSTARKQMHDSQQELSAQKVSNLTCIHGYKVTWTHLKGLWIWLAEQLILSWYLDQQHQDFSLIVALHLCLWFPDRLSVFVLVVEYFSVTYIVTLVNK